MHHPTGFDDHAVLLKKGELFAVCRMQPRRSIALSPNYDAEGNGVLSGPLNRSGLQDILQWADYVEAARRFRALADLPTNVVSILPDRCLR